MSPDSYYGTEMRGVERGVRCCADQRRNQACVQLSARSKRGAAATRRAFTATAWKNAMMLLQLAVILSATSRAATDFSVAFPSVLSLLFFVSSPSESLSLSPYNVLVVDSDLCSAILEANIFKSSPVTVPPLRMIASVRNGMRRMTFSASQSRSFF